jgi:predicted metalloprotease with PDZ domain
MLKHGNIRKIHLSGMSIHWLLIVSVAFLLSSCDSTEKKPGTMNFTVSMEQPWTHYYHVEFFCEGIRGEALDFRMPAWTPGYYMILDLAKYVINFHAEDGNGNTLQWEKISKNTWQVGVYDAPVVRISYDVYAFTQSVAHPFLDDGRGFISPTGIFMYINGYLHHPVTVNVRPYQKWDKISTGLEPVEGKPNTYFAPDFNVLYDCPILVGNQEILSFEVGGIPHYVAQENPADIDDQKYLSDLKTMVESAVSIIGEIPYKHYTFIIMDRGMGGLEHANSMAVFSGSRYSLADPEGYKRWLAFLAHEYFHLYNVKRIRPVNLGPFDYNRENYTNMLWFSEGVTVYYEYIILNRAGFLNREETLEQLRRSIINYENIPGHLFQPVTMSSFDTWILFFNRSENASNTTISYYDKGCALGVLLDLKIRHETNNEKSLDDVMRSLYYDYYKEKNRGFTDQEFHDVCEEVAGCSLEEIFEYASTTRVIDYPKYFSYAGLNIDTIPEEMSGAYLGTGVREMEENLVITNVVWNSPACLAGLSPRDTMVELNGIGATYALLNEILDSGQPGDKLNILVGRRTGRKLYEAVLDKRALKSYNIVPLDNPDPYQLTILNGWLEN